MPASDRVERHIRAWLESFVVGLNLCPFARPLLPERGVPADNLRIAICWDTEPEALRHTFLQELDGLQSSSEAEVATILLAFPDALGSFEEFLDFFADAQELVKLAGLDGLVQLASFHPQYEFAGEEPGAASHFSNRAPYPIIHLLREDMMERALADFPEPENIPRTNIETLEKIGVEQLEARWRGLFG